VLLSPTETPFLRENFLQGAPSVVMEIRSPGDEAYEKLPFYAALGAREVWIIDRNTREPEVHRLAGDEYQLTDTNEAGWLLSEAVGVELRAETNNKLGIRLVGDVASFARLP
jgi:Uma2 family endonuclease